LLTTIIGTWFTEVNSSSSQVRKRTEFEFVHVDDVRILGTS
jgi:hypothetical protein